MAHNHQSVSKTVALKTVTQPTCDGGVAEGTLLCVQVAEALDAVGAVSLGGEGLSRQRYLAPCTQETLLVPRLVLVGHPSLSQGLCQGSRHRTINHRVRLGFVSCFIGKFL